MKRVLLKSAAFVRAARRLVKKNPEAVPALQATSTICELSSSSSNMRALRPSSCNRSERTMKFIN